VDGEPLRPDLRGGARLKPVPLALLLLGAGGLGWLWLRPQAAGDGRAERLLWLSDLPSAGDTSYAGAVLRDGQLLTDDDTSRIDRNHPWLLGLFLPTDIRMARISLAGLSELARGAGS
jgi:hypothetical protein